MGRPPLPPGRARSRALSLRLRPDLLDELDAEAARLGVSRTMVIEIAIGQWLFRVDRATRAHRCPKEPHEGDGYLHGADDDTPFDVDGVSYCGRCHQLRHDDGPPR